MSVILMAGRKRIDLSKRDMSKRKKIIRKAGNVSSDGVAKITTGWELEIDGKPVKISFSRDNLHVWVNSEPVETKTVNRDNRVDGQPYATVKTQVEVDNRQDKSLSLESLRAYISDEGYDVDLFFDFDSHEGHIFSDVDNDRDEMMNYILIDQQCMGDSYQTVHHHNSDNKPKRKTSKS